MKKLKKRLIITGITLGALSKFLTNPKLEGKLDKNKVLIYFYGGGLSIDSFTASHDMDYLQDGFYYAKRPLDGLEHFGITSSNHDNPFKDYTILLIPYATGDMHVGNNKYHYKIFSVYIATNDYQHVNLKLFDASYQKHLDWLLQQSIYDTGVLVNRDDDILILQTCYFEPKDSFLIIAAKKI